MCRPALNAFEEIPASLKKSIGRNSKTEKKYSKEVDLCLWFLMQIKAIKFKVAETKGM